jgi:hypothetical protein
MPTFIKTGFWEKAKKGYDNWLNLDLLISQNTPAPIPGPQGPQGVQGPVGPQGAIGPVGPAGLNWQGAWSASGTYVIDDAVGYNGASWFCIGNVGPSATPPDVDTANWALLAAQGAQGPIGATGAQGPVGPQGPAGGATYKVYSALVAYNSGGLVVITVFENTLGASITWGTGAFGVSAAGTASSPVFTNLKTAVISTPYSQNPGVNIFVTVGQRLNDTTINLRSIDTKTGQISTPFGTSFFLEIRVYP